MSSELVFIFYDIFLMIIYGFFFQSQAEETLFLKRVSPCWVDSGSEGSEITGHSKLGVSHSLGGKQLGSSEETLILSHQTRGVVMDRIHFWLELRTRMQFMV